eukprot:gene27035-32668_t
MAAHLQPLYGGAMQTILSPEFRDVSGVREVPDHQEVFIDTKTDASIIVELLDMESDKSDDQALLYHFQELAKANEASETITLNTFDLSEQADLFTHLASYPRLLLAGKQVVQKHRSIHASHDVVYIFLVLVRLRNVQTDLLISLNMPWKGEEAQELSGQRAAEASMVSELLAGSGREVEGHRVIGVFRQVLQALQVLDWGLFGAANGV